MIFKNMGKEVKTKGKSYTLDEDVIEMVNKDSEESGVSRSKIISKILKEHYELVEIL